MQQRSTKQHVCKLIPPPACSLTVILSLALLTGSKSLRSQSRSLPLEKPRHRPRSHGTPFFWENPSAALRLQASGGTTTIFQYMVAVLLTESHFVTDIGNEHLLLSALLHQSCDPICYQNWFISIISSRCLLAVLFLSLCLFQVKMERGIHATSLKTTTTFVIDSSL